MKLLFELSQEHQSLPAAEVLACLESEKIKFELIDSDFRRILRVEVDDKTPKNKLNTIAQRIALCHSINTELHSGTDLDEIASFVKSLKLETGTKFRVTAKRVGHHHENLELPGIEKSIGELINRNYEVDLDAPDVDIRIMVADRFHIGFTVAEIDRPSFERRKPQNRPFFSPISLHPKYARALVNLSGIKQNDTIFDPFCGTGGILIEAGLIGAKLLGSDLEKNMVEGCKTNLEWAGLSKLQVFQSDVGDIVGKIGDSEGIAAIVTEPPYGRAATTAGETIPRLYERAFQTFQELLKENRFLIMSVPSLEFVELGKRYFKLRDIYSMRIHRSLVKHFCVFLNSS